jgi:hypothetical protein
VLTPNDGRIYTYGGIVQEGGRILMTLIWLASFSDVERQLYAVAQFLFIWNTTDMTLYGS